MKVVIDGIEYFPRPKTVMASISFGAFLKNTRKELDMTLEEASAVSGLSKSYLWGLENGKSEPSLRASCAISGAYGIPLLMLGCHLLGGVK